MSYELCKKVCLLEPYEPISGDYKIRLDANESYYNLPDVIKDEIKNIIDNVAFNRYPNPNADRLVQPFADYYGISPFNVTAFNGSDEVLYLIASAMLTKNSKVIVTEPDFSMYAFYSYLSENEIITYRKNDDLNIDVDELISLAKSENTDMIIFSNPCNPTGQGISAEKVRKLINAVNCLVVLDEAYMDFWSESLIKEAAEYDNLIVLKTASKAVGSAAIRLGFAVANNKLTTALKAVKAPYNVNTLSQEIGRCIYSHKDILNSRRQEIIKNTALLYKNIRDIVNNYKLPFKVYETCANFVFLESDRSKEIYEFLLENSVAVRYFRNADALRITTGNEQENKEFLVLFEKFIIENILKRNR